MTHMSYRNAQSTADVPSLRPSLPTGPDIDVEAARQASLTVNSLLDWRGEYQGDKAFLCPLDLAKESYVEYTFGQCAYLVRDCARNLSAGGLSARRDGERALVVGVMATDALELWVNKTAVSRL